ncbi:hypothetical protein HAX54_051063, partial [Datura stramonium]|nr:hypothetical protein [Datura stramonium]
WYIFLVVYFGDAFLVAAKKYWWKHRRNDLFPPQRDRDGDQGPAAARDRQHED